MNRLRSLLRPLLRPYYYLDERTPHPIRSTGILVIGLVIVAIITVIGLVSDHDWYNQYTAYLLFTTLFLCVVVMFWGTPFWSFRGVGILFVLIGDILIYGPILLTSHGVEYNDRLRLALARAFFSTGSIFVLYGLIVWVAQSRPTGKGRFVRMTRRIARIKGEQSEQKRDILA